MDESRCRSGSRARLLLMVSAGLAACLIVLGVVMLQASPAVAQDEPPTNLPEDDEPGTTPVSGRQPIVTNQFATTTTGALQERHPGLYVQQGIASTRGELDFLTGDEEPDVDARFVLTFEGSELVRGGGGPRCMTLPVCREPVD